MIIVHINPTGVEKVYFQAETELFEDFDLAVWPLVRKELRHLHKELRKATKKTLDTVEKEGL